MWPPTSPPDAWRLEPDLRRDGGKPSGGRRPEVHPGQGRRLRLAYGQSITDACIGWDDTLSTLQVLADAVQARRSVLAEAEQALVAA
jgi:hypothetical protein